jgi:hypothetical protein
MPKQLCWFCGQRESSGTFRDKPICDDCKDSAVSKANIDGKGNAFDRESDSWGREALRKAYLEEERSGRLKSPTIAVLLNLVLPGVGHLYASGGNKGLLILIVNILILFLAWEITPLLLINIGIWIYALAVVRPIAEEYNSSRVAIMAAVDIDESVSKSITQDEEPIVERITGKEIKNEIEKLLKLRNIGAIDDDEFDTEWNVLQEKILDGETEESLVDFLDPIATLMETHNMEKERFNEIKESYKAMASTRKA